MKITVDMIMAMDPCDEYPESRIRELLGPGLTPLEVLALDIPARDRIWAILNKLIFMNQTMHLIACDIEDYALSQVETPDRRDLVKRKLIEGKEVSREAWEVALEVAWAVALEVWEADREALEAAMEVAMEKIISIIRAYL